MKVKYIGLNVQFPISQSIADGTKKIETRTYPMPAHFVGKEVAIVETPGKKAKFKARVVCIAIFGDSFPYGSSAEFYADVKRHHVTKDSPWAWKDDNKKWGWPVIKVIKLKKPIELNQPRGIRYTRDLELDLGS